MPNQFDENLFRTRLAESMKRRHVNGAELSSISGVSTATISRYLNGLREPSVSNLVLLSDALLVSVDYLLGISKSSDDRTLTSLYSEASADDRRVIWTLLERYRN